MRIAVSGTHCSGKTTLVESFLARHRDYSHEPEPYEWLTDVYGEAIPAAPGIEDFYRQLEVSVERLRTYDAAAKVITERSPIDFLSYMLALTDLGRAARDCELIASAVELAAAGVANIDLLVVLPLDRGIFAPFDEDLELREAMGDRLLGIIATDEYSFFGSGSPRIVEITGSRHDRLRALENATHPGAI